MDESRLEAVGNAMTIPSNSLALQPIIKGNQALFISLKDSPGDRLSAIKDPIQNFELQSRKWNSKDIATRYSQNQTAFPLLYKGDTAIIRTTSTEAYSAKVGIHKLSEMSCTMGSGSIHQ